METPFTGTTNHFRIIPLIIDIDINRTIVIRLLDTIAEHVTIRLHQKKKEALTHTTFPIGVHGNEADIITRTPIKSQNLTNLTTQAGVQKMCIVSQETQNFEDREIRVSIATTREIQRYGIPRGLYILLWIRGLIRKEICICRNHRNSATQMQNKNTM